MQGIYLLIMYLQIGFPCAENRSSYSVMTFPSFKRRLESRQFLARYNQILKKDGTIEFKTDNRALFDFALEEVEAAGWTLNEKTFDLHADARLNEGNVMTEYEERFSAQGNPICKYIISR